MIRASNISLATSLLVVAGLLTGCAQIDDSDSQPIDIKDVILTNLSPDCADYSASYEANVTDVKRSIPFVSQIEVSDDESSCTIIANDIPNYDFNDDTAHWAEPIATQGLILTIPRNPEFGISTTELSLTTYNAVMLNGVVLDQLANGCYKPDDPAADRDGNIANGCGPSVEWRLNPMGPVSFGTDSHNGHTQPGGLYHYHGNLNALFDPQETTLGSPAIGFAADGFPIYGTHYVDPDTGQLLEAKSGYTLRQGSRPTTSGSPGGEFDGTYIQDFEFTGAGTLDECNGMTINGHYGYYVTDSYPYVMGCFAGTPDPSFLKSREFAGWGMVALGAFLIPASTLTFLLVRRRRAKANWSLSSTLKVETP